MSGFFKIVSNLNDQFNAAGKFTCEPQNSTLYILNENSNMTLKDDSVNEIKKFEISISDKQILLKDATLKNTL